MNDKEENRYTLAPIIFKEIGGTQYAVYGYFSPGATETAGEKIGRLLLKESERKGRKSQESKGLSGHSGDNVV